MPRYFFNVIDGQSPPDADGIVLANIEDAKAAALVLSGEMLRECGPDFWTRAAWTLEVSDEQGQLLLVLRMSAETPAAAPPAR